jgi:hypothetical protein
MEEDLEKSMQCRRPVGNLFHQSRQEKMVGWSGESSGSKKEWAELG